MRHSLVANLDLVVAVVLFVGCGPAASQTASIAKPQGNSESQEIARPKTRFPPLSDIDTRKVGEDWPSFLGSQRNSKSEETGFKPIESPKPLWRRRFGEGYAVGSVARGRYFQFFRQREEMILECMKAESGETLWTYKYPTEYSDRYQYNGGPRTSPVIDAENDLVFIYGPEGMLVALRASTGDEVWKVNTFENYGVVQNFFGVGSTPLLDGEKLIVIVGGSPPEDRDNPDFMRLRANGSAIVAFDKRTGKEIYKTGEELASYASPVIAKLKDERVGLAFVRGGLLGFDPENGKTRFQFPWRAKILESVNAATPVMDGSRVLITECYGPGSALLDISGEEPKVLWQDDLKKREKALKAHWNTPIVHKGFAYGSSGRHASEADVRCIDLSTGKLKWSEPYLTRSSLLFIDGYLLCQCEDGKILVLKANPEKFDKVCEIRLPEPIGDGVPAWSAPIISHGLAYFRDERWTVCVELIPEKATAP